MSAVPASGATSPNYHEHLASPPQTAVSDAPKAKVHRSEWAKLMAGDPVEINPAVGSGFRVMSVGEWAARFKRSPEFPECLACGSSNTKEHAFTQTWCRGQREWESESVCLDCHRFSWRAYRDPGFKTPEQHMVEQWTSLVEGMEGL